MSEARTRPEDYNLLGREKETMRDPYALYKLLLAGAPVFKEPEHGIYLVSRYEDIVEMKRQPRRFSNRMPTGPMRMPNLEDLPADLLEKVQKLMADSSTPNATQNYQQIATLLAADPPNHTRYRGMTNKLFNTRTAKQWESRIREIADELMDAVIEQGDVDWVTAFAHPLPLRTVGEILGVPTDDEELLDKLFGGKTAGDAIGNPDIMLERLVDQVNTGTSTRNEYYLFFNDRIRELRKRPVPGDFLSDLIQLPDDEGNKLSDDEILSVVSHFQVAGHETSTKMITQAMFQLARNSDLFSEIKENRDLVENLVEESLRYEAPVQGLFQIAAEDVEVGGEPIPKGSMLMTIYGAANRDPSRFENPDAFDVHRHNVRAHLSFGGGIHSCPGKPFARAEGVQGFHSLFERASGVTLNEDQDALVRSLSYILRGISELRVNVRAA